MTCNCGDSGSNAHAGLNALAERAVKLAMALPDDVTCEKTYSAPEAKFLSALRDLSAEYSLAHTWSEAEARSRLGALTFADAAFGYALAINQSGGGGSGGGSCTSRCEHEMRDCLESCDEDPDAGYTCYLDCRLAFYACLASCIGVSGRGGGIIIA
jgi:hypothetical protein